MSVQPVLNLVDDRRLAALDSYDILDTPPEEGFDDVVHLAAQACQAPVALVSLVDRDRQWFKARVGFPYCETDLNRSVCKFVLDEPDLLIIPDLTADARTAANPLVTGEPHIRFYAGAPLRTPEGEVLGSLCVIDTKTRPQGLTSQQADSLRRFARQTMTLLALRRTLAARDALLVEQAAVTREREIYSRSLAHIGAASGDLDRIFDALLTGAMDAVPTAEAGAIELIDGDMLEYRAVRGTLVPHHGLRVPLHKSLVGHCALTNTPLLVNDVRADPHVNHDFIARLDLRSVVIAPLARGDQVLGVLKLQSSVLGAFTPRDLGLTRLFAGAANAGLTEGRAAETQRALQTGEQRYKAVFDSAIDYAIIVLDLDGQVTEWNAGAEKILGWTADEMRGRPADVFFTPEDRKADIAQQEMHSALTEGRGMDERWHLRKSGERFWAAGEMMALRDEAGQAIGFVKMLRDRTEPRRNEEQLKAADERLQMALSASGVVGLWDWMVDTDLLHGDANFARLYGLDVARTAAGVTMEQYQEHVVLEDIVPLRAAIRATFETNASFLVEYRLAIPGESLRWVECKGRLIHDDQGRAVRFSGTAVDITARKQAETDLRTSQQELDLERSLLHSVFQQAPVGISIARADASTIPMINAQAEQMIGHGVGQADDGRYQDYGAQHADSRPYKPEDYPTVRALRLGEEVHAEPMRYRNARSGEIRLLEVSSAPVRAADGTIQAAATILQDVTDQRHAESEVRRLAAIVEQSGDFIGVAALDGSVAWVNEAGRRLVGLENAASARATKIEDYFDPAQWPEIVSTVFPAVDARGSWRGELRFRHFQSGQLIPVLYDVIAVRDEAGQVAAYATVTRDLSEQKAAEAYQNILNRELSHRMKNILAMVQAVVTQTLRNAPDLVVARDVLTARLMALGHAHDVLMKGVGHTAELHEVIGGALKVHDDQAGRITIAGPSVPCGPRPALSVALMVHELATNAAKYGALSTAEGHIGVSWAIAGPAEAETLTLTWQETGGPAVKPPTRRGFGSKMIERGLAGAVGGEVELSYPPEGVLCTLTAPVSGFRIES